MIRILEVGATVSGIGVVLSQVPGVPGVPENFQTWPATAIMGLLMLAMLSAMVFVFRSTYKAMQESAKALGQMAETQSEANRRSDELASKQTETNNLLRDTVTELRVRPCMCPPSKAKTQRIS